MALFKYINKNLYDMFFKPELKCKNQYDYLTMVYGWHSEKIDNFKRSKCDFNKISYQWMKNSMPAYFFDFNTGCGKRSVSASLSSGIQGPSHFRDNRR